jgi:hypothetical protein
MPAPFLISKPSEELLILTKSRKFSAMSLGGMGVFFAFWYGMMFASTKAHWEGGLPPDNWGWIQWLFWLVPLLSLGQILKDAKNVFRPREIILDSALKRIRENGKRHVEFADVETVQIKTVKDSDGPDLHHVAIRLKGKDKIRLEKDKDYEEMFRLADELSEFLKVPIEKSGG